MAEADTLPGMSAMCLTYGRVHALEEAIQCFLLQDYAGPKELVVLNDMPEQILLYEHPEVQIINASRRFETVGKKRDVCAHLATYDWLLPWDDDDIHLQHRMRYSMQQIQEKDLSVFQPSYHLFDEVGNFRTINRQLPSACCFSRDMFNKSGGYLNMSTGEDQAFIAACSRIAPVSTTKIQAEDTFYLYRRTGRYYRSSGYIHRETEEIQREIALAASQGRNICSEIKQKIRYCPETEARNNVLRRIQKGSEPSGVIHLNPHWRHDYTALCKEAIQIHLESN